MKGRCNFILFYFILFLSFGVYCERRVLLEILSVTYIDISGYMSKWYS
jgi:hypothetical protein